MAIQLRLGQEQAGSDLGRDIWGVRENGTTTGESICSQCVNRGRLTFAKARGDIAKVLQADNGVPHRFRIVARSKISAEMRDKIKKHAWSLGVSACDIWSGVEFEEFLRRDSQLHNCGRPEPYCAERQLSGSWGACPQLCGNSRLLSDAVAVVTFRYDFNTPIQRATVSRLLDIEFDLNGSIVKAAALQNRVRRAFAAAGSASTRTAGFPL